jgi:hypothetical protein
MLLISQPKQPALRASPGAKGHPDFHVRHTGAGQVASRIPCRSFLRVCLAAPAQCVAQLMPRAQQQHSYERAPHSQRVRYFLVTHVREISQHQRHPRAIGKPRQPGAHFFAGVLRLKVFELPGIGMLQRQRVHVAGFEVLPNPPATQRVPAMIACNLIEPRGERPRRIIRSEFLAHLHEYFRCRVFRVLARREQPAAKSENRRRVSAIELAPGVGISRPDLGQHLCQTRVAHRRGGLLSLHELTRRAALKYSQPSHVKVLVCQPHSWSRARHAA